MKSIPKLIRRFIGILLLSSFLLIVFNFIAIAVIGYSQTASGSPWKTATDTAKALSKSKNSYILSESLSKELNSNNTWAILVDNNTKNVIWHTENLPNEIPTEYSLSDISMLTRGYIKGYPTFTGEHQDGLVVLGFPKTSYWKHMYNSWDYWFIANFFKILLLVLGGNIFVIFVIYMIANTRLLKSVNPILNGIRNLPLEKQIHVKEKGVLSEIAASINKTSEILETKDYQLKRKETARANWIAGVSHDIRTPLSMIMGYAGQLESHAHLADEERQKAAVIRRQSERIKNLINDLNLTSKLEYNMQPVNLENINIVSIIRQVVVDFMNMDISEQYPIEWITDDHINTCFVNGDKGLLKRAITNIIQNSINHNENGCNIYITLVEKDNKYEIQIDDDGIGATDKQIEKLNNTPHYMVCDENTTEQRHGLGLLIVKQIMSAHHGSVTVGHSSYGGFSVTLTLPMYL
ncbi:sensor histidine kinase [Anaerosalibacter massiliensis]|uniref:sensor histidine kinase n=1 Tax=Anaerosalibacter massiliensis TaxID=1347392 RepID=UPI0005B27BA4|nr:HAMP domain-containing sensor histidine kinase [Anaerosalibacter massiliensis]